ncbi:MAG: hypothetical protein RLZZ292_1003 [Bacteroidota bacterium]|jgi:predicted RNA-binding protein (virulence factor B family)
MLSIGEYATLEIVKLVEFGAYLDGGPFGEVLLPKRYVPENTKAGDEVRVFIYCDSDDRVIATTETPFAIVGEYAFLKTTGSAQFGAFLDWGLSKDLLVPMREQAEPMEVGKSYVVKVMFDETTDRLYASSKLNRFIVETAEELNLAVGDSVEILVTALTDLGYKAIVNNHCWGVLFQNEVFKDLKVGDKTTALVKAIRPDGKLDLSLRAQGYQKRIGSETDIILEALEKYNGFLEITDKSSPELIYKILNISKKAFKQAVGNLYKARKISLEEKGIRKI